MRRFSVLQLVLLVIGFTLIAAGLSLNHVARAWDKHRYPNAVNWHGIRLVPDSNQKISAPSEDMLVVKTLRGSRARLTVYSRPDDGQTPQKMVKALCARDACSRVAISSGPGERAAAMYRIGGEAMQILLIRPAGANIWIEFYGPPDALQHFDVLIRSITAQLAPPAPPG